jgi:Uma2 family endonuclease
MDQTLFPRPPSETLPTMYDLPSEDSEEMDLPDEFHDFQPRPPSETLPTMYDLPSEDPEELGLPDEFHDFQPKLLRETCTPPTYPLSDIFIGADINLYYDGRQPLWHKRPDWFLSLGVPRGDRQEDLRRSYVMWQEFVTPYLMVELLSPGTEKEDLGSKVRDLGKPPTKWEVYERILRVPFYVVFDRYHTHLRVFVLERMQYRQVEIAEPNPRFWFDELELGLGVWEGMYQGFMGKWLRWYDASGEWIPTEAEARVSTEAQLVSTEAQLVSTEAQLVSTEAQLEAERSARRSSIPRLVALGLTVEQIAAAIGLSVAEVEQAIE